MRKLLITRAFSLGCLASSSSLIKVYTQELNGVGAENTHLFIDNRFNIAKR